jgi:hypothetical protein
MARRKEEGSGKLQQVRRSLTVEADKLERARKLLGASSDAEAIRLALDHVLSHPPVQHGEEE